MPDAEPDRASRTGRLFTGLFWFGVGLAPLAGLLLLVGGGALLRVAGVLAVLAVVLIGLSIALRPDLGTVRLQLEETLLEEIDALREDVREEIATASRTAHQSLGERIGAVQQQMEALRSERAALPAAASAAVPQIAGPPQIGRAPYPPPGSVAPPYSVAPRQSTPVRSVAPAPYPATPQSPPLGRQAPPVSPPLPASGPVPNGRPANGRAPANGYPAPGRAANGRGANGRAAVTSAAAPPPGPDRRGTPRSPMPPEPTRRNGRANGGNGANGANGVYRRADTGTMPPVGYGGEPLPRRDPVQDSGYQRRLDDSQEWSPPAARGRGRERDQAEESWTDQKLRERYGGRRSRSYDTDGGGSWDTDGGGRWRPVSAEPRGEPLRSEPLRGEPYRGEPVSGEPSRNEPISSQPISGEVLSAEPRRRRSHRWDDEDATGMDSTGARISERWSGARSGDTGRDPRSGGRRSARHSEDEARPEDRWRSAREDDRAGGGRHSSGEGRSPLDTGNGYGGNGNGYGGNGNGYGGNGNGYGGNGNGYGGNGNGYGQPDYARPALPAGSAGEPSWNDSWDEPVRPSRGRRYRDEDTETPGYGNTGRQRRLGFEVSDERWH